jgi:hypothetical protein
MTTTTPTPGPWLYQPSAGHHDYLIYAEATGRDVALVRDFNEANATLIAQAPVLRELLDDFVRMATSYGLRIENQKGDRLAAARAVLAEIDGGAR